MILISVWIFCEYLQMVTVHLANLLCIESGTHTFIHTPTDPASDAVKRNGIISTLLADNTLVIGQRFSDQSWMEYKLVLLEGNRLYANDDGRKNVRKMDVEFVYSEMTGMGPVTSKDRDIILDEDETNTEAEGMTKESIMLIGAEEDKKGYTIFG